MNGLEWFGYPWEFGVRKAKAFLLTSDIWSARESWRLGMVNHVAPDADLESFIDDLADRIAARPAFALKHSYNAAQDAQGPPLAIDMAF